HASRVPVSASRRNDLSLDSSTTFVRIRKKSSRSRGRARQHARRVRYPQQKRSCDGARSKKSAASNQNNREKRPNDHVTDSACVRIGPQQLAFGWRLLA